MNICQLLPQNIDDDALLSIAVIEREHFYDAWQSDDLKSSLSAFGSVLFVAFDDKKVIGYCVASVVFETAEILRIAVSKSFHRRGVASALMTAFIQFCQKKHIEDGTDKILLEVRADNVPAIAFYQKFGFEEIFERKDYYKIIADDGQSQLVHAKILQKTL